MGKAEMADVVKAVWFGREVTVLVSNGKAVTGELSETSQNYIVLKTPKGEIQIMVHAIIMIKPSGSTAGE
jgi:sRNA-binding regulator protein Hfq